ncbi:MAG: hypothetical protein AAGA76_13450, partial [Pseudomonadota bacterium]
VCDVEKYPDFVPLCKELHLKSEKQRDNKKLILADEIIHLSRRMLDGVFFVEPGHLLKLCVPGSLEFGKIFTGMVG